MPHSSPKPALQQIWPSPADVGGADMSPEHMALAALRHEIDHLDGVLFVDHISGLKRGMIMRKLTKLKKQDVKADA